MLRAVISLFYRFIKVIYAVSRSQFCMIALTTSAACWVKPLFKLKWSCETYYTCAVAFCIARR